MTLRELMHKREEISYAMLEADSQQYDELMQDLEWIEEMIEELQGNNEDYYGEENEN